MTGYLKHARDWTITRDAIVRMAVRLGKAFTYAAEIEEHDALKIASRGYAAALEAVARNIRSTEPLWTSLVINAQTGEPGDGLWKANPNDRRYADAGRLSKPRRATWLERQQAWCIAAARSADDPLNPALRGAEAQARDVARTSLIDLLLADHHDS